MDNYNLIMELVFSNSDIMSIIISKLDIKDRLNMAHTCLAFIHFVRNTKVTKSDIQKFRNYRFEEFIENNLNKINMEGWYLLSGNIALPESFFEKHLNKIDWCELCTNRSLSEAFFERHLDNIDWDVY